MTKIVFKDNPDIMFANNPNPMWIYDIKTLSFLDVNKSAIALYGFSRNDFLSMTLKDIRPISEIDRFLKNISSMVTEPERSGPWTHQKKDGTYILVEIFSDSILYENIDARLVLVKNLTDDEKQIEAHRFLAAIVRSSEYAIFGKKLDGTILSWNNAAEKIYGYSSEEMVGRSVKMLCPPEKEKELAQIFEKLKNGKSINNFETIRQRKDGTKIQVSITVSPLKDDNGQYTAAATFARDITEQKKIEKELREKEGRLKYIAENIREIFYLNDLADAGMHYISPAYQDIYGKSLESWYEDPKSSIEIVHPDFHQIVEQSRIRQLKGSSTENEYKIIRPDGEERWIRDKAFPIKQGGKVVRVVGIAEDITEKKNIEEQLRQARQSQEEASYQAEIYQKRLEFIAEASSILNSSLDYHKTIKSLGKLFTPAIADWFAVDLVNEENELERIFITHANPEKIKIAEELMSKYPPVKNQGAGVHEVIKSGSPEVYKEIPDEMLRKLSRNEEHYNLAQQLGLHSALLVPLKVHEQILGAITFVFAETNRSYDENDIGFAEELARRTATAIENSRLYYRAQKLNEELEERVKSRTRQLIESNITLEHQINERLKAEIELKQAHNELEDRVQERTRQLEKSNLELQSEIKIREEAEKENYKLTTEIERQRKRLNDLVSHVPGVVWEAWGEPDINSQRIDFVSSYVEKLLGYTVEEWLSTPNFWLFLVHPDDKELAAKEAKEIFLGKRKGVSQFRWISKSGRAFWVEAQSTVILDENDKPVGMRGVTMDISERIKSEERVQHLGRILEDSLNEIYIFNAETLLFTQVNRGARKNTGYSMDELKLLTPLDLKPNFSYQEFIKMIEPLKSGAKDEIIFSTSHKRKDGTLYSVEVHLQMSRLESPPVFIAMILDISERKLAEERIESSLREKEILLREIHHRVKNNLQIISSLLNLQSGYIKDESTIEYFRESQNRIKSMALIHEKLYRPKDLSKINFNEYITELALYLSGTYNTNPEKIKFVFEISDISLTLDTSITLGLIINELISNSLKYAFPNNKEGYIKISLSSDPECMTLSVCDNGVGIPKQLKLQETNSLGLQLVSAFSEQIGGSVDLNRDSGTAFTIKFKDKN